MFTDLTERFEISWYCFAVSNTSIASYLDCIKSMISCSPSVKNVEYVIS